MAQETTEEREETTDQATTDHNTVADKTKDRLVAEYALSGIDKPIGVAEYQLVRALPESLVTSLPTVEQLGFLADGLADCIEPLRTLYTLIQVLSGDTSEQSFNIQSSMLTIIGLNVPASLLMQALVN